MVNIRRNYSAEEKARIALEALKETMTIAELSSKYGVHASQIGAWKKRLKEGLVGIFLEKLKWSGLSRPIFQKNKRYFFVKKRIIYF